MIWTKSYKATTYIPNDDVEVTLEAGGDVTPGEIKVIVTFHKHEFWGETKKRTFFVEDNDGEEAVRIDKRLEYGVDDLVCAYLEQTCVAELDNNDEPVLDEELYFDIAETS